MIYIIISIIILVGGFFIKSAYEIYNPYQLFPIADLMYLVVIFLWLGIVIGHFT